MSNVPAAPKISLDERIETESIPFPISSGESFPALADRIVSDLGDEVALLGFGEALHGGEEILQLRNQLFRRLVEKHGYSAIAIESSFPRARQVDEYVHGRGFADYEDVRETGFGHGLGRLEANRELVEWMRAYNLDPDHATKLSFYGFDIPTGNTGVASPRSVLAFVVGHLAKIDAGRAGEHREKIEGLLGDDASWENPAVYMDPSASIALSPSAVALRIGTEDLLAEMRSRRPELVAASSEDEYREALHCGEMARQLLNFHAAMGSRRPGQSPATVLGTRDASMSDNLVFIRDRERNRGKLLAFAHNSHLQRGEATWPGQNYWGTDDDCRWWPAGSHLAGILGPRYAVIGSALGVSRENGIGEPEAGTLEAKLTPLARPTVLLPTRAGDFRDLPTRAGSVKNPTYVPLDAQAAGNFDWIALVANVTFHRGGSPLDAWDAEPGKKEP